MNQLSAKQLQQKPRSKKNSKTTTNPNQQHFKLLKSPEKEILEDHF
jgi:hypothetical protein